MSGRYLVGTHPYAHPQHIKVVKHLLYIGHWCAMNIGWVNSLNHYISPSLMGGSSPDFWQNSLSLVGMSGHSVVGTHPYSHPQHIKVVKHLIYITLMWDEYGLGVQPQSPHFIMSYWLGVTQNSSNIPIAWLTWAAVMWWGHIHMHIHSI